MEQLKEKRIYDLEDRTFKFAQRVRNLFKTLPKTLINMEDGKQLIRASGSIGANYIEASEALSKKDFLLRIKISLKEAKESRFWLSLLDLRSEDSLKQEQCALIQEAHELASIFGSIVKRLQ